MSSDHPILLFGIIVIFLIAIVHQLGGLLEFISDCSYIAGRFTRYTKEKLRRNTSPSDRLTLKILFCDPRMIAPMSLLVIATACFSIWLFGVK